MDRNRFRKQLRTLGSVSPPTTGSEGLKKFGRASPGNFRGKCKTVTPNKRPVEQKPLQDAQSKGGALDRSGNRNRQNAGIAKRGKILRKFKKLPRQKNEQPEFKTMKGKKKQTSAAATDYVAQATQASCTKKKARKV